MEICEMSLVEALNLLLHHEFTNEERAKRLKIKIEISQIIKRTKEEAAIVANETIGVLESIRDKLHHHSEIGIADLLSLINSKTESSKKTFTSETEKQIRRVISWKEWEVFPPESNIHIFRQ